MICAGFADGGKDACLGDSGGPLMVKEDGRYHQAGIISFGIDCGESYGVYTRVPAFLDWLSLYVSAVPDPDSDDDPPVDDNDDDGGGGGSMGPWWLIVLLGGVSIFAGAGSRRMGD